MAGFLLAGSTQSMELVTSSAANIDVFASWVDDNAGTITPSSTPTAISSATTTTIVAAPSGSVIRHVKGINIRNKHASLSCTVTIQIDVSATNYELHSVVLLPGGGIEYVEGVGWFPLTPTPTVTISLNTVVKLTSDYTNNTVTPSKVTGMDLTTGVGTFLFSYWLLYQTAAVTTGFRLSVDHTGTLTAFVANVRFAGVTTTASAADAGQAVVAAAAGIHNSLSARAKSQAAGMVSASVDAANSDMLVIVEGLFICTVDGNLGLWAASEVAASQLLIKTGSSLIVEKVA